MVETTRRVFMLGIGATGVLFTTPVMVSSSDEGFVHLRMSGPVSNLESSTRPFGPEIDLACVQLDVSTGMIEKTLPGDEMRSFKPHVKDAFVAFEGPVDLESLSKLDEVMYINAPCRACFRHAGTHWRGDVVFTEQMFKIG